jgi:hypothetical protein
MNIEETNLEAHVRICQERYESLDYKLDQVDLKFQSIEARLASICLAIEALKTDSNETKFRGFEWIIGVLLTVLGYLLAKFIIV